MKGKKWELNPDGEDVPFSEVTETKKDGTPVEEIPVAEGKEVGERQAEEPIRDVMGTSAEELKRGIDVKVGEKIQEMKEGEASPESIAAFKGMASQLKDALVKLYDEHPGSILLSGFSIMFFFRWLSANVSDFGFISGYDQELMFQKAAFAGVMLGAIVTGFGFAGWKEQNKRMLKELSQQKKDDSGAETLEK